MGRRSIVTCALLFACICAPANAQLVYSADGQLYEIGADGSDRGFFTAATSPRASDSEPEWSPDGTQLAVVHQRNVSDDFDRSRIDLLSADGSSRRRMTRFERGTFVASPGWSRDGSRVVFVRFTQHRDRYRSAIVIRDLADEEERTLVRQRLGRRLTSVALPEWSPDGESVLYSAFRLDRSFHFRSSIYTVPAEGGSAQLLARDAYFPAFSPDGSRIAFISIRDRNGETCGSDECSYNGELYVMDADGGNAVRLTRSEGDDLAPDWSPDGSRIAFNSNRNYPSGFAHEIYSIEPDGDCLTWLTNGTANSSTPAWRPSAVATDPGGCRDTPRPALVETDLSPARAFDGPRPLWLGLTYRGLLLSEVTDARQEPLYFGYYDCDRFRPRDCLPPMQVLVHSVCSQRPRGPFLSEYGQLAERRRRALVVDFGGDGGIEALTGGLMVHVLSEAFRAAPARTAFRALRPFPSETNVPQLAPPVIRADLAREIRRVERLHRRLGSVAETADRLGLSRRAVRTRLGYAQAFRRFGHRVGTTRC
jgi:Tol biopolymer transport system component